MEANALAIWTVRPVNVSKTALLRISASNLQSQQTVGIGYCRMQLHIDGVARDASLQDAHTHTHRRVDHQHITCIAHHRLLGEFLWHLRKEGGCTEER